MGRAEPAVDHSGGEAVAVDRPAVLHVSQPGTEGVANVVRWLSAQQAAVGGRIGVACPAGSPLAEHVQSAGADVLPWMARRHPGPALVQEARDLGTLLERFQPDIVHLHSSKAGTVGRLVIRGRLPTVFQPHAWSFEAVFGAATGLAVVWERAASRWTDAIVSVSDAEREAAVRRRIRAAGVDVTIANPVDTEEFRPAEPDEPAVRLFRRSLGLTTEPIVVCPGRLCHQKGQDLLVRAWPAVVASVPDARLVLVGDGPIRSQLEALLVGFDAHVLGERADVADILRAAQVVVMPSRWEGMSLAMLEAMATAKPVVITDVGGARETVGRGAGAIVPIGDIDRLGAAIVRRLTDADLAAQEGRAGRAITLERHTMAATAAALDRVYRTALERHAQAVPRRGADESDRRVDG